MTMNERNDEILKLYNDGLPYGEISDRYGITKQRVAQIVTGRVYSSPKLGPNAERDKEMYRLYVEENMTQLEIGDKYDMAKQYVGIIIRQYAKVNNLPLPVRNNWKGRLDKQKHRSAGDVIDELAQMPNAPIILSKPTDTFRAPSNGDHPQYNGLPHHKEREVRTIVGTIRKLEGNYLRTGIRSIRMSTALALNVHRYFMVGNVVSLEYYPGDNMLKSITLVREGGP